MNYTNINRREKRKRQEEINNVIQKKIKNCNMLKYYQNTKQNDYDFSSLITKNIGINKNEQIYIKNVHKDENVCTYENEGVQKETPDLIKNEYNDTQFWLCDEMCINQKGNKHAQFLIPLHKYKEECSYQHFIRKGLKRKNEKDIKIIRDGKYDRKDVCNKNIYEMRRCEKNDQEVSRCNDINRLKNYKKKLGYPKGKKTNHKDNKTQSHMWEGLLKKDVLLLLIQAIKNMGYKKSAKYLELESGIELEQPLIKRMHKNILLGKWKNAIISLKKLNINKKLIKAISFLIYEQCFIEYLYEGKYFAALRCLRNKLEKCCFDQDTYYRLHQCTTFFMIINNNNDNYENNDTYENNDNYENKYNYNNNYYYNLQHTCKEKYKKSRSILFEKINRLLPEHIIIPPRRLAILLHQSLKYQVDNCLFHNHFSQKTLKSKRTMKCTRMDNLKLYKPSNEKRNKCNKSECKVNQSHRSNNIKSDNNVEDNISRKEKTKKKNKNEKNNGKNKINYALKSYKNKIRCPTNISSNNEPTNNNNITTVTTKCLSNENILNASNKENTTFMNTSIWNNQNVEQNVEPNVEQNVEQNVEPNEYNITNINLSYDKSKKKCFMTYPTSAEKTLVPDKCNKEEECQEDVYNANTSNPTSLDIYSNSTTYENQRKKKRNIIIKQECNEEISSNNDQNYILQEQNNDIIIKEGTNENIIKTYEEVIITYNKEEMEKENITHNNDHINKRKNKEINNLKNVGNNILSNNNSSMELLNYKNKCCISNEIQLDHNNVDNEKIKQMKLNYNVKDKKRYMNKNETNKLNNNNNNNIIKTCNDDEMYQSYNCFNCKEYRTKKINNCYKHNELHALSLLKNHECKKIKLPYYCIKILQGHKDEVWYVNVSSNGKYIASSSKDKSIFLWKGIYPFNKIREWNGHIDGVSYIIWSHNSKYLVSGSNDSNIIIWSPKSNKRKLSLNMHSGPITSICWSKDDSIIVSSAFDKKIFCTKLNQELKSFSILYSWSFSTRIQNFVFTNNDQYLIVVASDKNVRVIDYNQKKELYILPEFDTITSVCASKLYNHILVNIADQKPTIKLWDVKYRYIIQTYRGHKQGRFIVHSTFGGKNEDYVISGSEDSLIYIWHKTKGYLLDVINGHASTVSIAIWPLSYSKFPYMISASDDHTLMIWNVHPKINKIKKQKKKARKKFIHPFLRELTKYHSIKN